MEIPTMYLLVLHTVLILQVVDNVASSSSDVYRTGFHFQPPRNWMNDPNGPMYHKGLYHLFYQYNPYGAAWGNIVWAHSVSENLVDWVHLEQAIYPTGSFDENGCWSGSATILPGGKPAILYTGDSADHTQVQNLALPKNESDPLLREWIKSPYNPLIVPPQGVNSSLFRDPTTAWQGPDKLWRILIGSQINGRGTAILYKSEDFIEWTEAGTLFNSSAKTEIWECPDFYPVSIKGEQGKFTKYVLKASFMETRQDHYVLGYYNAKKDRYSVETDFLASNSDLRYDYGKFYASKTFYDGAKRRRILWGWIPESDDLKHFIKKGWAGLQSIPRSILLGRSGKQLVQWPIEEIEKLRTKEVKFQNKDLHAGSVLEVSGITASQADVDISFEVPNLHKAELMDPNWVDPQLICSNKIANFTGRFGPFGFLVLASDDFTEQTAVFFRIFKRNHKLVVLMCSDQSRSSLRDGLNKTNYGAFVDINPYQEKISLRSLIDHSIIESFAGEGKTCITARVYPRLAIADRAHLYVFNNGSSNVRIARLSAWSMKNARMVLG